MEPNPDEPVPGEGNFAGRPVPVGPRSTGIAKSANGAEVPSAVDLTLSFGQRKMILSDVSVDVQQGTVTALIGHSRAGRPANGN